MGGPLGLSAIGASKSIFLAMDILAGHIAARRLQAQRAAIPQPRPADWVWRPHDFCTPMGGDTG